jgi:hypothetical protein
MLDEEVQMRFSTVDPLIIVLSGSRLSQGFYGDIT